METQILKTDKTTLSKWDIDLLHSEIMFKIKHLVISTVTGSFSKFEGKVNASNDGFENANIELSIDVDSIYTGQAQRDVHLRNGDFFGTDIHPKILFSSTSLTKTGDDSYLLKGNLTLKGVTKEIELNAVYGGTGKDTYGNIRVGFEVSGNINRKDWGLSYNALTETGGLALGEVIRISANVQLVKDLS